MNSSNTCEVTSPGNKTNDRFYTTKDVLGYTDSILKWKVDYHDIQFYGDSIGALINSTISSLVKIEREIQNRYFEHADSLLNLYDPESSWEADFKSVYQIWVNLQLNLGITEYVSDDAAFIDTVWLSEYSFEIDTFYSDTSWHQVHRPVLNDSLTAVLTAIAAKNPNMESPAAYSARVLLFALEELDFQDSLPQFYPSISGWVDSSCNWSNFPVRLDLFTSTGDTTGIFTYSDEDGYFRFDGVDLQQLDTSVQYYAGAYLDNDVLFISEVNKWKQLAFNGPMLFSCSSGSPNKSRVQELTNGGLQIFPNPTNGLITVSGLHGTWTLQVTDITGKKVLNIQGSEARTVCDLSGLKPGVYFIYTHQNHNHSNHVNKIILE
jgi:hypothetical protein